MLPWLRAARWYLDGELTTFLFVSLPRLSPAPRCRQGRLAAFIRAPTTSKIEAPVKGFLMRFPSLLLAATILFATPAITNLHAADPAPPGLSVYISFSPAASKPDAFSCSAEITDLATGAILAKPQILGIKGESGQTQVGDETSKIVLAVLVNKAGTNGTYTVTYSKSGKVVGIQKGSISL